MNAARSTGESASPYSAQLLERASFLVREIRRRRVAALDRLVDAGWSGTRHVGVNAEQFRRGLNPHRLRDGRAPVAALRHEPGVAEALHQHDPGPGDAGGIPPGGGRLGGESVPGQRGNHQVERFRAAPAVRLGIGQRLDDLQLLYDRARPPVRDDQRQRIGVPGADVKEMDAEPVDLGDEVRQLVQLRLAPAPVVICRPVPREILHHRERHALRVVGHRLGLGPPGRVHAAAQIGEFGLGETDRERADGVVFGHFLS
jgi:hypothetical protein